MIRCIIVDDEPLAIEVLEGYLKQISDSCLLGSFTDPLEAFAYLKSNAVDIVFLDLNMPVMHGMEFLQKAVRKPQFIITTAYREYAVESFEWDVVDYLVKPVAFPRFSKAYTKAVQLLAQRSQSENDKPNTTTLWLKADKKLIAVEPKSILYVQSLKDYIRVVTSAQKIVTYSTLQAILLKLDAHRFIQIHKSYLVNIDCVEAIEGNVVHVSGVQLPVGRSYRSNLLTAFDGLGRR